MNFLNELIANDCEIFPVQKNKKPCTTHGLNDSTNDIATIKEWRSKFSNCRWALRLDKANLIVADFDNHGGSKNGTRLYEQLPQEQQDFLKTCPIDISNHGFHFFMKLPKGQKLDQAKYDVSNGLEILTLQVNLYDPNKPILEAPEAPQFILDMLKPKSETQFNFSVNNNSYKPIRSYWVDKLRTLMQGTIKGNRDTWLTSVCGTWLNSGLNTEEVFKLLQFANMNCDEPLSEKEIRKILYSICKRRG